MFFIDERNEVRAREFDDAQAHDGPLINIQLPHLYLGPATITRVAQETGSVELQIPKVKRATVRMAVAAPYHPAIGDEVLVISQGDEQTYVIGVLKGSGLTKWSVPGDLVFEAPQGGIRFACEQPMLFHSDWRVDIASKRMTLRAARLEFAARSLVQRVGNAYLWIKGLLQVKSRRCRTLADEDFLVKAKRARLKSEGDFNIDGKTIHLG